MSALSYQPVTAGAVAVAVRSGVMWNMRSCPFPKDSLNSHSRYWNVCLWAADVNASAPV